VAFSVRQLSCVDCPCWMESGFTEREALGAGGGGGGGGGAVTFFLAQPTMISPRAKLEIKK